MPLKIQIKHIENHYRYMKSKNSIRKSTEDYSIYLRLLDSKGASIRNIAEVLYPNDSNKYPEHKVSRKINEVLLPRAKFLRDNGYYYIAIIPD